MNRSFLASAAFLSAVMAAPAAAQDYPTDPPAAGTAAGVSVSGEILLLSDYRFRGISRSDRDPALQAAITASLPSGFYAGGRGTTLDDAGRLGHVELDLYAGYGGSLGGGTSFDVGVMAFVFPDGDGATDYLEPYASLSHQIGPVLATAGAKYAFDQDVLGGEDALYLFGEAEAAIPFTPVTVSAGLGRQEVGGFDYWNWSLGARYQIGAISAGVRYVDTDLALDEAEAGLVFSLGLRF